MSQANTNNGALVGGDGEAVMPMQLGALSTVKKGFKPPIKLAAKDKLLPLEAFLDVPVTLVFEVGRTEISVRQLMELAQGAFIELRNVSVDNIDVRINDVKIANAETIGLKQRYGIRFGELEMPNLVADDE